MIDTSWHVEKSFDGSAHVIVAPSARLTSSPNAVGVPRSSGQIAAKRHDQSIIGVQGTSAEFSRLLFYCARPAAQPGSGMDLSNQKYFCLCDVSERENSITQAQIADKRH
jgi:hypothetical protein